MAINILVNGAFGRMGQIAVQAIAEHTEFKLVKQTGKDDDLLQAIKQSHAQVVIDFTHPDHVFANTLQIIEANACPVIGTTGLTIDQIHLLQEKCSALKLGGVIAPNFSLGAVLMMKYAKECAKYIPHVEIIEMHHENKIDSPSGTALRSAELLSTSISKSSAKQTSIREIIPGARGANHHEIPIHAIRLPGFLAHQQIIFGNPGETLTMRHDAIDRKCFMPGIALACKKVTELTHLVYGLEELL